VREAVIWSSLLARVSIPVLHSAVAILKIAELKYSGTNRHGPSLVACPCELPRALSWRVSD